MKRRSTALALSLLLLVALAGHASRCAAERITRESAEQRLRPHLQVQESHGEKHLEIQSPRKLGGRGGHEEASAAEPRRARRMAIGHKGGSVGGVAGGGSGGRNVGGGGAVTRPHGSKNAGAALPVPVLSVLALAFGCGVALSAFGF